MENEKVIWVRGNRQPLLIPLEQEVIRQDGDVVTEPYYPEGDATVNVYLVGRNRKYPFRPEVDGNLLTITEDGSVPAIPTSLPSSQTFWATTSGLQT